MEKVDRLSGSLLLKSCFCKEILAVSGGSSSSLTPVKSAGSMVGVCPPVGGLVTGDGIISIDVGVGKLLVPGGWLLVGYLPKGIKVTIKNNTIKTPETAK